MSFKKIIVTLLVVSLAALSAGCVKREIVVNSVQSVPDMEIKEGIEIDWEQVMDDCNAILNEEDYPYGAYLDFAVDDENHVTKIIWPLKNGVPKEACAEYADAYIKAFNDCVATQDFGYALSTEDYYGGYWDKNDIDLQVYDEATIMEPQDYYINQIIPAGSNDPIQYQVIE